MELRVRKKKAHKTRRDSGDIPAIQKAENEIDKMKEKFWVVGLNYEEFHRLRRARVDGDAQRLSGAPGRCSGLPS